MVEDLQSTPSGVDEAPEAASYRPAPDAETTAEVDGVTEVAEAEAEAEFQLPAQWEEDPNFRQYQSNRDKREAQLRQQAAELESRIAELEEAQQQSAQRIEQTATTQLRRQQLATSLGQIDEALESMDDSPAKQALEAQAGQMASELVMIDIHTEASRLGVDPEHQRFVEALQAGQISDPRDITLIAQAIALEESKPKAKPKAKKQPEPQVDEADLRKRIEADVLQQYGISKVPGAAPQGTASNLEAARREYKALQFDPNGFERRLALLREFPELHGT